MRLHQLRVALEEISDGKAHREIEHTFFARLENRELLNEAKEMEHHEQWEIPIEKTDLNAAKGKMRVRKTVKNGLDPEYVLTFKTAGKEEGNIEVGVLITEPMFTQFKMMSEKGMIKDRYLFPVEGSDLVWEVDMFLRKGSQPGAKEYEDWCKIDLEVPSLEMALPPIPQGFSELITNPYGKRTDAEEAKVVSLFHNEFITPNQYL
jgi:hypothetical protein